MIFVTVGSQKFQFNRLLQTIDKLVENGEISEEVFAQRGTSDYIPQNYFSQPFLDRAMFKDIMEKSDLVITHGGSGTIIGALKAGKKVIAVPRMKKYGEHVDDHQIQIIKQFMECNLIEGCLNVEELGQAISEIKTKTFEQYISNTQAFIDAIDKYISEI